MGLAVPCQTSPRAIEWRDTDLAGEWGYCVSTNVEHRWPNLDRGGSTVAPLGLMEETAQKIAGIIYRIADVEAVAITDRMRILAYTGGGCPHMRPGAPVQTQATRRVLDTGSLALVRDREELHCPDPDCPSPIQSAVVAPLHIGDRVVGAVKLYRTDPGEMPLYATRLAQGMSELLSLELSLGESERQRELLAEARLDALQAQIRPHFLFNVLNTVIATSRQDPDAARRLLTELSQFLRSTLSYHREQTTLAEDLAVVDLYLRLEGARFGSRVKATVDVDPSLLALPVPVLTLEPLVENAVTHGVAPREALDGIEGHVVIRARRRARGMVILVADNGVGISPERVHDVFQPRTGTGLGLGLWNVRERLQGRAGLRLKSRPGRGTVVRLSFPSATWGPPA